MTFSETICTRSTFGEQQMILIIKTVYLFKFGTSVYSGLVIMWNRNYPN